MDRGQFDALAKLVWAKPSRRTALGALLGALVLGSGLESVAKRKGKNKRRKRRKRRPHERQYPVFTTCHTDDEELGPIPGGPYPTCQSFYDLDEFAPCNTALTFNELQELCNQEYAQCDGACRILAEPIVGLGDCPDYVDCVWEDSQCNPHSAGKIPGGPYGSCWSWWNPFMRCWSCPGATHDYNGMVNLCGTGFPQQPPAGCVNLGKNICHPDQPVGRLARPTCPG